MRRPVVVLLTAVLCFRPSAWPQAAVRATAGLPGPEQIAERIVDGRLRLTVDDAVRLTLRNNTAVRAARVEHEASRYGIQRVRGSFDPQVTSSFRSQQRRSATTSQLE